MEKLVILTGATGGIGREIAAKLIQAGYLTVIVGRNREGSLESLARELNEEFAGNNSTVETSRCIPIPADLTREDEVKELFCVVRTILEKEHAVSYGLIHCAGVSVVGLMQDMTMAEWTKVLDTNLTSAFLLSREMVPLFIRQHEGRILFISSVWGNVGASMEVAYSASKGGLNTFAKALGRELAPSGISVNALACGFVDTKMNAHLTGEEREQLKEEIPMGRFTSGGEVAQMVMSMLTMPEYVTGQVITMDGGWT